MHGTRTAVMTALFALLLIVAYLTVLAPVFVA